MSKQASEATQIKTLKRELNKAMFDLHQVRSELRAAESLAKQLQVDRDSWVQRFDQLLAKMEPRTPHV